MLVHIKANERGHADHGWLKTWHTFSFADYYDPERMGYRSLRVINDDKIAGGRGFATHGHRDMEIITYIVSGAIEHKDTMGNSTVIRPGEVQRMTAGTGVRHSEFNYMRDEASHLFQIWIIPEREGLTPGYEQKSFSESLSKGEFVLVASRNGEAGSVVVHQDVRLYAAQIKQGQKVALPSQSKGRGGFIQFVQGEGHVGTSPAIQSQRSGEVYAIQAGDGIAFEDLEGLQIAAGTKMEILFFDLG